MVVWILGWQRIDRTGRCQCAERRIVERFHTRWTDDPQICNPSVLPDGALNPHMPAWEQRGGGNQPVALECSVEPPKPRPEIDAFGVELERLRKVLAEVSLQIDVLTARLRFLNVPNGIRNDADSWSARVRRFGLDSRRRLRQRH